jgi:hypothetical protein
MKRVAVLLCALVLLVPMAGCSGTPTGNQTSGQSTVTDQQQSNQNAQNIVEAYGLGKQDSRALNKKWYQEYYGKTALKLSTLGPLSTTDRDKYHGGLVPVISEITNTDEFRNTLDWHYLGTTGNKLYIDVSGGFSPVCGIYKVGLYQDNTKVVVATLEKSDPAVEACSTVLVPVRGYIVLDQPLGNRALYHAKVNT